MLPTSHYDKKKADHAVAFIETLPLGDTYMVNGNMLATASSLFRFRIIPHTTIKTDIFIICEGERYNIVSVEDVKGRGMYVEILCSEIKPSG